MTLLSCGSHPAAEDFRARFLENRWENVTGLNAAELVAGLRRYIDSDDRIFPRDDPHAVGLHEFLFRERPDPRGLLPLFAAHGPAREVDGHLLKRDLIAYCAVTSLLRRIVEDPEDRYRRELYAVVIQAGIHFAFDPVYGDSYTHTGSEVTDFFTDPRFPPSPETRAGFCRWLPAYLEQWRRRTTDRASSTFFGIVLRHLGREGAVALCGEFEGMDESERVDLLDRLEHEERMPRVALRRAVEALLDPSFDVREAAYSALKAHGAPVADLDVSGREEELRRALGPLRDWAAKTKS